MVKRRGVYIIDDKKYILRSDPIRKSVRLGKTDARAYTHTHTHTRLSIIIDVLTRSTFRARKYCLANNRTLLTAIRAKSSLSHARRSAFPPSHPHSLIHYIAASLTISLSLLSQSVFFHCVERREAAAFLPPSTTSSPPSRLTVPTVFGRREYK